MKRMILGVAVLSVVVLGGVLCSRRTIAQSWGDVPMRCAKVSSDNGVTTTCICQQTDRLWHDTDCDRVKDAGEYWIDFGGPASSTDEALVRYDGTTGTLVQDYSATAPTASDAGIVSIPNKLTFPAPAPRTGNVNLGFNISVPQRFEMMGDAFSTYPGDFGMENTLAMRINPPSTGDIITFYKAFNAINGGSYGDADSDVTAVVAGRFTVPATGNITAAGTTQGTATTTTCTICTVATVTAGVNDGVKVKVSGEGERVDFVNISGATMQVWPQTGGDLGAGVNTAIAVLTGTVLRCTCYGSNTCDCIGS